MSHGSISSAAVENKDFIEDIKFYKSSKAFVKMRKSNQLSQNNYSKNASDHEVIVDKGFKDTKHGNHKNK